MDEQGGLVSILSARDLKRVSASDATALEVHELRYLLDKIKLSEVMTILPLTTTLGSSIESTAKLAAEHKLKTLPVLDHGKRLEIVTSGDFLRVLASRRSA